MTREDIEVLASIDLDEYVHKIGENEKKSRTPRIVISRSDGLVMSSKRIHGSIGSRSRISLYWIPITKNIRNFNEVEIGELVE